MVILVNCLWAGERGVSMHEALGLDPPALHEGRREGERKEGDRKRSLNSKTIFKNFLKVQLHFNIS